MQTQTTSAASPSKRHLGSWLTTWCLSEPWRCGRPGALRSRTPHRSWYLLSTPALLLRPSGDLASKLRNDLPAEQIHGRLLLTTLQNPVNTTVQLSWPVASSCKWKRAHLSEPRGNLASWGQITFIWLLKPKMCYCLRPGHDVLKAFMHSNVNLFDQF